MSKQPITFEEIFVKQSAVPSFLIAEAREVCWAYIEKALEKSYMGDSGTKTAFKKEDIK